MVFYVYKIKDVNYIGSTDNIKKRTTNHKTSCYNKNSKDYNILVYQYIREKQIEIKLKILGVYKRKCNNKIKRLIEQFYINEYNSINDGLNSRNSFTNIKKYEKKYYQENREKAKLYYEKNKERKKKYVKKYNEENKECKKKYLKKYLEENKEKIKKQRKKYREENKEKIKERKKKYREENKEKLQEYYKKYSEENKEKLKQKINCPKCNSLITKRILKRHQKSKKCISAI